MKKKIEGVITALATPFNKSGEVCRKSFKKLLKSQMDQGVDGLVVNGTTGESPSLDLNEVKTLFAMAKAETEGKIPILVGTGLNSTAKTVELSKKVSAWKPEALLVVVPYYNKPPQRGLVAHFSAVAKASRVPIVLYNVPGRTVAGLEAATIGELARHKNIIGIKEATGKMDFLEQIKKQVPKDFALLSGDDASCVDFCARGGHGVISVSSHIIGGEMKEAIQNRSVSEYASRYAELMKHLYIEANPIPLKAALHWMGIISSPGLRLPLVPLDERFHADFKKCLGALGKI